jgi:hypothetical protein
LTGSAVCHTLDDKHFNAARMRVNARLDDESAEQIDYLTRATGLGVSHVLRESVALFYRQVRAQRAGLAHFGALVGKGDSGRSDIASDVKRHLGEGLDAKHRRPSR